VICTRKVNQGVGVALDLRYQSLSGTCWALIESPPTRQSICKIRKNLGKSFPRLLLPSRSILRMRHTLVNN
jgi:hypothetical protein